MLTVLELAASTLPFRRSLRSHSATLYATVPPVRARLTSADSTARRLGQSIPSLARATS